MIQVSGTFYLAGSTTCFATTIHMELDGTITLHYEDQQLAYRIHQYEIEPRLGSADRLLRFADGSRFESPDHEGFARMERIQPRKGWLWVVDWLESRWPAALACLIGLVGISVFFIEVGLPMMANHVAHEVPQPIRRTISEETLESMEKLQTFKPSESTEDIDRANAAFTQAKSWLDGSLSPGFDYELRVYEAPGIGANAFALPSGIIVVTEALIDLELPENQLQAIILHEIAHVEAQHGLRSVIQQAGLFMLIGITLGDVSSVGGLASSLPTLLTESRYSRRFEKEADRFAAEVLLGQGIGVGPLKDALISIQGTGPDFDTTELISSHPSLRHRLEALDAIASQHTLAQ